MKYMKVALPVVAVTVVQEGGMKHSEIRSVHQPKIGSGFPPEFFPEHRQLLPVAPAVKPKTVFVGLGNLRMATATESKASSPMIVRGTIRGTEEVIAQYAQYEIK